MEKQEILKVIETLAQSQGSYGRLKDIITEEALQHLEEKKFTDVIDLVIYLETR